MAPVAMASVGTTANSGTWATSGTWKEGTVADEIQPKLLVSPVLAHLVDAQQARILDHIEPPHTVLPSLSEPREDRLRSSTCQGCAIQGGSGGSAKQGSLVRIESALLVPCVVCIRARPCTIRMHNLHAHLRLHAYLRDRAEIAWVERQRPSAAQA